MARLEGRKKGVLQTSASGTSTPMQYIRPLLIRQESCELAATRWAFLPFCGTSRSLSFR